MKKNLVILLFISQFSLAQNPLVKQWDNRFGGTDEDDIACFQQTSDGGYVIGGYSHSSSSGNKTPDLWGIYDYWIVKTDSMGVKLWDTDFGGTLTNILTCLQQTNDGGYILGGWSSSDSSGDKSEDEWGNGDYWIVKIDSLGNKIWDKDYGGTNGDELFSLQQTTDGGYILGGQSYSGIGGNKTEPNWNMSGYYSDYWIVKTDSIGGIQWQKDFGGKAGDFLHSLKQTADKGFILGGYSISGSTGDKTQASWGYFDYWILKTDSLGNKEWDKDFGGTGDDRLYSLLQTSDGGYILGGKSFSGISGDKTQANWDTSGITPDYWIVKTDSAGNLQWDKDFGGSSFEDDFGNISETIDGGYLIAGSSGSPISGDKTENNIGPEETWVIKIDSLGNKQWDKMIFTASSYDDELCYAIQTKDGCYTIVNSTTSGIGGYKSMQGWGNYDYWVIKFCDTSDAYLLLPNSAFIVSDQDLCEKHCTNFTDSSEHNPTSWQWIFSGGDPPSSTDQNPTNICYNLPGTYDVTLITTNANGSDTLTLHNYITVNPTPAIPTITPVGYTLTSSLATSYQWQLNSVDIPGATNQSYTILQTGYYTVIVGDTNGCVNSATEYVLISGVDDINDGSIFVSPNPSSGSFTVQWLGGLFVGDVSIDVVNTLGQKVFASAESRSIGTTAGWKKQIDLRNVTHGVYFIEIKTANEFVRKKIVIE